MASEYVSTSSVFLAILSIIHENELSPSNHSTVLCMRTFYSGEFKSHERASRCSFIYVSIPYAVIKSELKNKKKNSQF